MELVNLSNDQWLELVDGSPQGTIFHEPCYLESLGLDCDFLGIEKKGNLVGGIALPKSEDLLLMPYQAYNGFIFHPSLNEKKNVARIELRFQISEFLADELIGRYKKIKLACIDYEEDLDMRGFHWKNYHEPNLPTFRTNITYTSVLDTSYPVNQTEFRKGRQSSFNKSKKFPFVSELSTDVEAMDKIYLETFDRQEIDLPEDTISLAHKLFRRLIREKKAFLCATSLEGELASMSMIGIDGKRAYYLFGANKTEFRSREAGTANLCWGIEYLKKEMGVNNLEMLGVNSPQRGSFKLSFGGSLKAYYQLEKIDKR